MKFDQLILWTLLYTIDKKFALKPTIKSLELLKGTVVEIIRAQRENWEATELKIKS
jgi:hypothetical protein